MSKESTQRKLTRVRPPRVHITYDVEVGGAVERLEIPFVVGVLTDLTGQPEIPLPRLKERRFVEVTVDNFDAVLAKMNPRIAFQVEDRLSEDPDAPPLRVVLQFSSLRDFEPEYVAQQIMSLRELLERRA